MPRLDVIGIIGLQLVSASAECSGSPLGVAFVLRDVDLRLRQSWSEAGFDLGALIDRVGPHYADSIESFESAVPWYHRFILI